MPPLPPVERGRGARRQAAAAGLQRVDPPRPGQPAGQQAERDRGRRDGHRGQPVPPRGQVVPHAQPGRPRRRGQLRPGVTGRGQRGQPGRHHRQAVPGSPVQPPRRPAQEPGQGHRIAARQRHRQSKNQQPNASQHADHPGQRADHRTQGQEAEVPGDHASQGTCRWLEPKGRAADWTEPKGRGAGWTDEGGARDERRARREGGAVKGEWGVGGVPEAQGAGRGPRCGRPGWGRARDGRGAPLGGPRVNTGTAPGCAAAGGRAPGPRPPGSRSRRSGSGSRS